MMRLHTLVEGQTEETFFNDVMVPYLWSIGISADVQLINHRSDTNARLHKGGWRSYQKAQRHLQRWMKEDQGGDARFTTMVDLYALPSDFPGQDKARNITDPHHRVISLQEAWHEDIDEHHRWRFVPYIQLHEFEALLLADPRKLDWEFLEHDEKIDRLVELSARFDTPELINDGRETAPSKRIIKQIPEYESRKASAGPLVASKIGLPALRERCPHFDSWINRLETLSRKS